MDENSRVESQLKGNPSAGWDSEIERILKGESVEPQTRVGKLLKEYSPGGDEPTGTIDISENGTHDVKKYASANVNVPTYPEPQGTITITENGMAINVKDYALADVAVPTGIFPSGSITVTENGTYDVTDKEEVVVDVKMTQEVVLMSKTMEIPPLSEEGEGYIQDLGSELALVLRDIIADVGEPQGGNAYKAVLDENSKYKVVLHGTARAEELNDPSLYVREVGGFLNNNEEFVSGYLSVGGGELNISWQYTEYSATYDTSATFYRPLGSDEGETLEVSIIKTVAIEDGSTTRY